ncbi:MAG: hypothetical protein WCD02_05670 [Terriglobales bacterium]
MKANAKSCDLASVAPHEFEKNVCAAVPPGGRWSDYGAAEAAPFQSDSIYAAKYWPGADVPS